MSEINIVDLPWSTQPDSQVNDVPDCFDVYNGLGYCIRQRIGSASMNGQVYEVEHNITGTRIALKLMSIGNEDECKRATIMGEKYPLYFPNVISWDNFPHVIVRNDGKKPNTFLEFAEREFICKYILDRTPVEKRKRFRVMMRKIHTNDIELMRDLRELGVHEEILNEYVTHKGIGMTVMANELMSGDMKTLVIDNPLHEDIPRLIGEVFTGLQCMVREKIVHEDLHLGNILIRKNKEGHLSAVIHDFGESTEDRSPYEHTRDIFLFLDSLIPLVPKYENIIMSSRQMINSFLNNRNIGEITQDEMIEFLGVLHGELSTT